MPSVIDLGYQQAQQQQAQQVQQMAQDQWQQRENLRRYQQQRTTDIIRDSMDRYFASQQLAQQDQQFQAGLNDRKDARAQQQSQFGQSLQFDRDRFQYGQQQDAQQQGFRQQQFEADQQQRQTTNQLNERSMQLGEQREQRMQQQFDAEMLQQSQQGQMIGKMLERGSAEGWLSPEDAQHIADVASLEKPEFKRHAFELLEHKRSQYVNEIAQGELVGAQATFIADFGRRRIENSRLTMDDVDEALDLLSLDVPFQKIMQTLIDKAAPDTQSVRIGGKMFDIPMRVIAQGPRMGWDRDASPEVKQFWIDTAQQIVPFDPGSDDPDDYQSTVLGYAKTIAETYGGWKQDPGVSTDDVKPPYPGARIENDPKMLRHFLRAAGGDPKRAAEMAEANEWNTD